jgi:hypothetical protein
MAQGSDSRLMIDEDFYGAASPLAATTAPPIVLGSLNVVGHFPLFHRNGSAGTSGRT